MKGSEGHYGYCAWSATQTLSPPPPLYKLHIFNKPLKSQALKLHYFKMFLYVPIPWFLYNCIYQLCHIIYSIPIIMPSDFTIVFLTIFPMLISQTLWHTIISLFWSMLHFLDKGVLQVKVIIGTFYCKTKIICLSLSTVIYSSPLL